MIFRKPNSGKKDDGTAPRVEFSPSRILANGKAHSNLRISYPKPLEKQNKIRISRGSFRDNEVLREVILPPGQKEYSLTIFSAKKPCLCRIVGEQGLRAELTFYPSHWQSLIYDWIPTLVMAFVIAFFLRTFIVAAFYIPSRSMEPTLLVHDRLIADKISFVLKVGEIEHGDIIIFKPPPEAGEGQEKKDYIKRVIGLPGDKVLVKNGKVWINGKQLEEDYIAEPPAYHYEEVSVPEGYLFVLGDNRNNSKDSHSWDFLPVDNVIGRALFIFWPPNRIGPLN
ncbi:signal peptidase I [bacterium]|nr:signal peptidase I [bacterium]